MFSSTQGAQLGATSSFLVVLPHPVALPRLDPLRHCPAQWAIAAMLVTYEHQLIELIASRYQPYGHPDQRENGARVEPLIEDYAQPYEDNECSDDRTTQTSRQADDFDIFYLVIRRLIVSQIPPLFRLHILSQSRCGKHVHTVTCGKITQPSPLFGLFWSAFMSKYAWRRARLIPIQG